MSHNHTESKRVYRYKTIRYWAENGMISLIDEADGETRRIRVEDFCDRAKALALETKTDPPTERMRKSSAVEDMLKCAEEANNQGNPFDPKVQAHNKRHNKYKKPQILVPGNYGELTLPLKRKLIL